MQTMEDEVAAAVELQLANEQEAQDQLGCSAQLGEKGPSWFARVQNVGVLVWDASVGCFVLVKDGVAHIYQGVKDWWNSQDGKTFFEKVKALWSVVWGWIRDGFNYLADKAIVYRQERLNKKA